MPSERDPKVGEIYGKGKGIRLHLRRITYSPDRFGGVQYTDGLRDFNCTADDWRKWAKNAAKVDRLERVEAAARAVTETSWHPTALQKVGSERLDKIDALRDALGKEGE